MSESEFWHSTPYITRLCCKAAAALDLNRYRHDLFTGYHAALLSRVKDPPSLESLMRRLDTPRQVQQSPEDILRIVEALNAQFGGVDKRKKKRDH